MDPKPNDAEEALNGTKLARGANFKCVMSGNFRAQHDLPSSGRTISGRCPNSDGAAKTLKLSLKVFPAGFQKPCIYRAKNGANGRD